LPDTPADLAGRNADGPQCYGYATDF